MIVHRDLNPQNLFRRERRATLRWAAKADAAAESAPVVVADDFAKLAERAAALSRLRVNPPPERAPESLFRGPKCDACGQQKLRPHPSWPGFTFCFGCGDRREAKHALLADVERFFADLLVRLRRPRPLFQGDGATR